MEAQPNGRSTSNASQSPIVNECITSPFSVITPNIITPDITPDIITNTHNQENLVECNDAGSDKDSRSDSTEHIINNGRRTE
jgi:hypothetical protein